MYKLILYLCEFFIYMRSHVYRPIGEHMRVSERVSRKGRRERESACVRVCVVHLTK